MERTSIAELPGSNVSCFEDHIQYGRLEEPQDNSLHFSEIESVYHQRSIHPFAIISFFLTGFFAWLAFWVFESYWIKGPLALCAIGVLLTGVRGFFVDQIVILDRQQRKVIHNCYDPRQDVELFTANCAVALSVFRSSKAQ